MFERRDGRGEELFLFLHVGVGRLCGGAWAGECNASNDCRDDDDADGDNFVFLGVVSVCVRGSCVYA